MHYLIKLFKYEWQYQALASIMWYPTNWIRSPTHEIRHGSLILWCHNKYQAHTM